MHFKHEKQMQLIQCVSLFNSALNQLINNNMQFLFKKVYYM